MKIRLFSLATCAWMIVCGVMAWRLRAWWAVIVSAAFLLASIRLAIFVWKK